MPLRRVGVRAVTHALEVLVFREEGVADARQEHHCYEEGNECLDRHDSRDVGFEGCGGLKIPLGQREVRG